MTSAKSLRIRTKNCRSRPTALSLIWFWWDVKEPTPQFEKGGVGWVGYLHRHLNWSPTLLCVPHHMAEVITKK